MTHMKSHFPLRPRLVVFTLVALAGTAAHAAWVPGSGDVDADGVLTTKDAQLITELLYYPARLALRPLREACDVNEDDQCDLADATSVLQRTIVSTSDYDGDGVPNTADCAPFDDRLSSFHTYYPDYDTDSYGNPAGLPVCSVKPPAHPIQFVTWHDDPDDLDGAAITATVQKGSRQLGLHLGDPAADGRWRSDLARELGVDAVSLHLPWNAIETTPSTYSAAIAAGLTEINASYPGIGLKVNLTISPIQGQYLVVPEDLRLALLNGTVRFNDPAVINRYKNLLSFVRGRLPDVGLVSIQMGHEVDQYFSQVTQQQFWPDFAAFYEAVGAHARQLWGEELAIGLTATYRGLLNEPTRSLMQSLNTASTVVSVQYLPRNDDFTATPPQQVQVDIQQLIALYYPKKIHFVDVGYPSAAIARSSTTMQSQFLQAFFSVWDRYAALIPYASFYRLHDVSRQRATGEAQLLTRRLPLSVVPVATGYIESLGLRTYAGAGQPKAAYRTLRNLAFDRGWWHEIPLEARSFRMGFTHTPHDLSPDIDEQVQVYDWMWAKIGGEADIVNLHLDEGVPWVEALADTFTSANPPYSSHLMGTWSLLKHHLPPGHDLIVSINPLGIPRELLANYWGYGEGFSYSETFDRIPNGQFADMNNRMPPGPWASYRFNDPEVKIAYLKYCIRTLEYFKPDYLVMAIEVSATMNRSPERYAEFLELHKFVYGELKKLPQYSDVKLMVSFSATSFMSDEFGVPFKHEDFEPGQRERQLQGFFDILPYTDVIGLSLYPHYGKYNAFKMPASAYDELFELVESTGKPIAVTESGWPGDTYELFGTPFTGSAETQDRFFKLLFSKLENSPSPVEFFINFRVRDGDMGWERQRQLSLMDPPQISPLFVEFYKYFRDIGVYDGDGLDRPGTERWRSTFQLPLQPKTP